MLRTFLGIWYLHLMPSKCYNLFCCYRSNVLCDICYILCIILYIILYYMYNIIFIICTNSEFTVVLRMIIGYAFLKIIDWIQFLFKIFRLVLIGAFYHIFFLFLFIAFQFHHFSNVLPFVYLIVAIPHIIREFVGYHYHEFFLTRK